MEVAYYLLPYILLLFLSMINISVNSKVSNTLMAILLFLFAALRYDVGYDYMNYADVVKSEQIFNMEFFEALIIELCHKQNSPQLFFVINSFITVFCVYWAAIKKSPNVAITLFAFLCLPLLYLHSMSIVRFWTALSMVFLASTYLLDKRYLLFIVINILAIGFHNAAIVGFLFLPLSFVKLNKNINLSILAASFVLSALIRSFVSQFTESDNLFAMAFLDYANADEGVSGFSRLPYVFLVFDLYFLLGTRRAQLRHPELSKFIDIYNIGCCVMFLLVFQPTLSSRLSRFFIVYVIFIAPYIISERGKLNITEKRVAFYFICSFLYIFMLTIFNKSLNRYEYLPYQLFF